MKISQQTSPPPPGSSGVEDVRSESEQSPVSSGWHKIDSLVFAGIACVLIVTALAKSWMLVTDPFVDIKTGYPVILIAAAIIVELGLVYLLFTQEFETKVLATLLLFSAFLAVSTYRVAVGKGSCGCLGNFEVSPIVSALVNLAIISIVVWMGASKLGGVGKLFRSICSACSLSNGHPNFLRFAGVAFGLLLIAIVSEIGWVKSSFAGILHGERTVIANSLYLGEIPNEPKLFTAEVILSNSSPDAATLIGSSQSCSCTSVQINGQEVPAMGQVKIPVTFTKNRAAEFHHRVRFFLDHPHQFSVDAEIIGRWNPLCQYS